jgi:hypothetical protein
MKINLFLDVEQLRIFDNFVISLQKNVAAYETLFGYGDFVQRLSHPRP